MKSFLHHIASRFNVKCNAIHLSLTSLGTVFKTTYGTRHKECLTSVRFQVLLIIRSKDYVFEKQSKVICTLLYNCCTNLDACHGISACFFFFFHYFLEESQVLSDQLQSSERTPLLGSHIGLDQLTDTMSCKSLTDMCD